MAVQFSLSYDANGDPVLVENTVTGTRKVVSSSPVISEFKSRFATPDSGDPVIDAEENQPDSNESSIYDYINEMESGAANDINLSFIEKQNLEGYTPEAIAKKEAPLTKLQSLFQSAVKAVIPTKVEAGLALLKIISKFAPEESPEIKAIKQHYATPEMANLVESIPGMSNYNLVYGNPFDPSYGLANAAQKRINTIDKTLQRQIDKGLDPSQTLIERKKKLEELIQKENDERGEITRKTTGAVGAQFKETGYADPGVDAEENQPTPPSNNNDGDKGSNNQPSSTDKSSPSSPTGGANPYSGGTGGLHTY